MTIRGIYEIDGDTLRLCVPALGGARPTRFVRPAGGSLMTFRREKATP
ncbi:MAG: hypothetical protein L0Z62_03785 [Gemmataceae bacterium]|nr:hypothetical protein [Gemmataceae bacterium]